MPREPVRHSDSESPSNDRARYECREPLSDAKRFIVSRNHGCHEFATFDTAVATPKTSLTLRVPADAKVWLAGNETASSGAVRLFETTTLKDGQAWKNYEIKVATVVDGKEQVVSKTIDLVAGKSVELSLDPAQRTASADAQVSIR